MKIALGVTGCIGAYKAALILRHLQTKGVDVEVVMTRHAQEFVQPLTFQALSGHPVITDMFAPSERSDIYHITLAQNIDLLLIAPCTANMLAKFAHGIADDFLTTLYLSTPAPVLIAPAMNVEMWRHPATQKNLEILRERGHHFVDPDAGYLACGMEGSGRLADPLVIADRAVALINHKNAPNLINKELNNQIDSQNLINKQDLMGEHLLVTAGPTREYIDPVRFITNRSSGKMGYAIAEAAQARGAKVTLISGPVNLKPLNNVAMINVVTTHEMYEAVMAHYTNATMIIKSAAVSDYRPQQMADQKIKKKSDKLTIELEKTEDILAALGKVKGDRLLVGFAAETEHVIEHAQGKLAAKNLDMIVANDVTAVDAGFDKDTNRVTLILRNGNQNVLPLMSKREVADRILDTALSLKQ